MMSIKQASPMHAGELLSSLSIAISAVMVCGHLPPVIAGRTLPRTIALGLVLGLGALGSMTNPIHVQTGVIMDLRVAMVASAGFVGGPLSAIIAAVLPLLYRIHVGGLGAWAGYASIVSSALIGATAHRLLPNRSVVQTGIFSLLTAMGTLGCILLLPSEARTLALGDADLIIPVIFGATWLAVLSLNRDERLRSLIEKNNIYRAIIETLPDSLNAKDLQSRFVAANKATAKLMQVDSVDDLIGKSDRDFYAEDMANTFREEELQVLENVIVGPVQHEIELPDGSRKWLETLKTPLLDARGRISGVITHNRDITDRYKLKRTLEAAQAHFSAAVSHMAEGLVIYDNEGTIRFCNQQYRDLHPRTADLRVAGARFADISRASIQRGEKHTETDLETWIVERFASLRRTGEQFVHLNDGRLLEARTRQMEGGDILITYNDITALKRNESDAREANRLLLMAEEVAHVGHWHFNIVTDLTRWSDEVFRIHGLDPAAEAPNIAEAIEFYHPDDREHVERCIGKAMASHASYEFSLRLVRANAEVRHVISRGFCEVDAKSGKVTGLFGILQDVTEITIAQDALAEKSAHLEATLDTMDQGIVRIAPDGTIDLCNRRFGELLALPEVVLLGGERPFANMRDVLGGQDDFDRAWDGMISSGSQEGTQVKVRSDGRVLEMRSAMLPDGAELKTYSDITARWQAERAVQDSEARYRMLADSTSDVITQLDLDLTRRYVSPACRLVLGYEPEEMIGMTPADSIHPDDVAAVRTVMERLAAGMTPGDRAMTTNRMRHKHGHWIWLEAGINLVREPATGAPKSLICSLRDVTERQLAARELERAKLAAEGVSRMKSEFVANMTHELRTPLTGVLGIHDLLASDPTLAPSHRRHIRMARDAGHSLLRIVNDVLDFSKIEAGELSMESWPFSVTELVEISAQFVQEDAHRKALVLRTEVDEVPDVLLGDAARMRQVVMNLLSNAIKFTEQGSVTLQATYCKDIGRLRVEVADTGIGIAEDKLPMLFGRFIQADASITRRFGGTGLGLAISKRLVNLMGGEIGVASTLGHGSTFWFEVPLKDTESEPASSSREIDGHRPVSFGHILLAEDNEVNQEIIRSMLEQRGHRVTVVGNGAEAFEACQVDQGYQVVLMDLQMPVMDGLSASTAIRAMEVAEHRDTLPIIGLTANAMVEDFARCRSVGMQGHIAKPIEWGELFTTIDLFAAQTDRYIHREENARLAPAL